ncbi:MAG: hypothetical protein HFE88_07345 [Acutalibacter sp.]|nr:hypothetical protein [Acutalibacter sp.]
MGRILSYENFMQQMSNHATCENLQLSLGEEHSQWQNTGSVLWQIIELMTPSNVHAVLPQRPARLESDEKAAENHAVHFARLLLAF